MKTDLFISYAWTSGGHREWVRLFASQLHLLGYSIKIDEKVDYGSSLSGFMREITTSKHVLLIVDENYVDRANRMPNSGVGIENTWIKAVIDDKQENWLSVIFVNNPKRTLPTWLENRNPKGFDFNADPEKGEFPGSVQIDEVWRWIEGLAAHKDNAVPISEIRKRSARIERIDAQKDLSNYRDPSLTGRVKFKHNDNKYYTVGQGEFEFKISFSGCSHNSVYVYIDSGLKAVGLIPNDDYKLNSVEKFLTPGRSISPKVGQSVVLMNTAGILCTIKILDVQREVNEGEEYIPEFVDFEYQVLTGLD